jgi:inosine-uridine nucleoside N-ribohydrolase
MDGIDVVALSNARKFVVAVDPTDTDNLELLVACVAVFGVENVALVLTGRCAIHPDEVRRRIDEAVARGLAAKEAIPMSEWDREFSKTLLAVSALRFQKIVRAFGHNPCPIYDGGLAKAPRVPHHLHMNDLYDFGDVTEDEVTEIEDGERQPLKPLSKLVDFLGGDPFIVFLGGPATGLNLALNEHPELIDSLVAVFGQYGSLGSVRGMEIEGRGEKAQFNVALDADSGKALIERMNAAGIPFFMLPTDVTRRAEIGFGSPKMLEGLLGNTGIGLLERARQRRIWYQNAIRPRNGELLLTHDLSTLFLYLQIVGRAQPVYELQRMSVTNVITDGADEGTIEFVVDDQDSSVVVATGITDRDEYIRLLAQTLQQVARQRPLEVILSTSLSPSDLQDQRLTEIYHERLLAALLPLLERGATVHWGSHPAVQGLMTRLAELYPGQLVQHLLRKYSGSAIANVRIVHADSTEELTAQMVPNKDIGIFIGGRMDVENSESGYSGVFMEHLAFRLLNPVGQEIIDVAAGGAASYIAALEAFQVMAKLLPGQESWQRIGRILQRV